MLSAFALRRDTNTAAALQKPLPTAIVSPTPAPPRSHLWLSSPVPIDAPRDRPDRFYPYGSTGQGRYQVHHGVEFANPSGTAVLAVTDGTVAVAGSDDGQNWGRHLGYYGQLIVIRLKQRYGHVPVYVLYGHLSRIYVRLGQRVRQGDEIGQVGSSGVALGPHLHLEVRVGRNTFSHTRNPELWLAPLRGHGLIVGRILNAHSQPVPEALVTFHPKEQPDGYWREAWTYPDRMKAQIRSDNVWRENFVMGDVPQGEYIVAVRIDGRLYTRRVWVEDGRTTAVTIHAEPTSGMLDASNIK